VSDFDLAHSTVEETEGHPLADLDLPPLSLPPPFTVPHESDPRLWAWRKALDFVDHEPPSKQKRVILAADTIVVARREILGKPKDADDAMRMLRLLSGDSHYVVSGYCLLKGLSGEMKTSALGATVTEVNMRDATDEERAEYIATGEPFDKAGAYAVQGLGGRLVGEVKGCYTTVVGLPLCGVWEQLRGSSVPLLDWPENGYCPYCPRYNT
jgi:septum formation protein